MTIHLQQPVPGWLEAVSRLPAGGLVKSVTVQQLSEAKAANPAVNTMLRYVNDPMQHVAPDDTEQVREQRAREWFNAFIDNTFLNGATAGVPHWKATKVIGWWNEYYADSQSAAEKELWWKQERTAARIWRGEYRNGPNAAKLGHIRLAICATAVGNNIPLESAFTAVAYDAILDYHPYDKYFDGGQRDPLSWQYHCGRWNTMDAQFREAGYTCDWLFGEAGPYGSAVTGWRHETIFGGDVARYVAAVRTWVRELKTTHAYQTGRLLGFALFTTGGGSQWQWFETKQPELNALADMVRQEWTAVTPPPTDPAPLPPAVVAELWELSDAYPHKINFAPQLGLWKEILYDDRAPLHTELATTIEGQPYAVQAAFREGQADQLYVWTPGQPILIFDRPTSPPVPHVERPVGTDVSRWQGVINWQKMKAAGAWYAFIKATEHNTWVDPLFDENWQGAQAAGLLVGAYHFFRPGYDPIAQANHFVNTVKAQPGAADLPFVLDVEIAPTTATRLLEVEDGYMGQSLVGVPHKGYGRINTAAVAGFANDVQTCLERIGVLTGRLPLLYTGIAFWDTYLRAVPTNICQLWLANWTTNAEPFMPKDWLTWHFWQYSNSGNGPQYGAQSARIDLNRWRGTLVQLHEYAGGQ
jgi:lysozyme